MGGTFFLKGIGQVDVNETLKSFAGREDGSTGKSIYSGASDFFFQVVFAATCMSNISGAVAERMKLWAILLFSLVMVGFMYSMEGSWTKGAEGVFGSNLDDQFSFTKAAAAGGLQGYWWSLLSSV